MLLLMNTDTSAQLARADFAGRYPLSIVDFRWFGGTVVYGYTLWASILMAHIGAKLTGAAAAVVGTWFTVRLLGRARPAHPVIGGLAAAVTQVANVVEGRITFAVGLTCGLIAVSLVTTTRLPRSTAAVLAALFGALCGGASPVAALLLGIPGAVALFARRRQDAALLLIPAAGAAAVTSIVFGDGGRQPFSFVDCARSVIALAVVLAVVPARCRLLRIGAVLGIVLVVAAFILPTPVGSNASRLSLLFALPVTAAFVELGTPSRRALLLLGMCLTNAGEPGCDRQHGPDQRVQRLLPACDRGDPSQGTAHRPGRGSRNGRPLGCGLSRSWPAAGSWLAPANRRAAQ